MGSLHLLRYPPPPPRILATPLRPVKACSLEPPNLYLLSGWWSPTEIQSFYQVWYGTEYTWFKHPNEAQEMYPIIMVISMVPMLKEVGRWVLNLAMMWPCCTDGTTRNVASRTINHGLLRLVATTSIWGNAKQTMSDTYTYFVRFL